MYNKLRIPILYPVLSIPNLSSLSFFITQKFFFYSFFLREPLSTRRYNKPRIHIVYLVLPILILFSLSLTLSCSFPSPSSPPYVSLSPSSPSVPLSLSPFFPLTLHSRLIIESPGSYSQGQLLPLTPPTLPPFLPPPHLNSLSLWQLSYGVT